MISRQDEDGLPDLSPPENSGQNLSGQIVDGQHQFPIRVYYEDTDFSGLVYHASYLRWCERARTEFVRLLGLHQRELYEGQAKESAFFVVRRMELDYLKPALMDDLLDVLSVVTEIGTASVKLTQTVQRGDTQLFKAGVTIVLINGSGRPQRISPSVRGAFDSSLGGR